MGLSLSPVPALTEVVKKMTPEIDMGEVEYKGLGSWGHRDLGIAGKKPLKKMIFFW